MPCSLRFRCGEPHGMTPNLGRGACDALIDAVTLAAALGGARGSLASRLARWQARRLTVTQAARIASTGTMRVVLHLPSLRRSAEQ